MFYFVLILVIALSGSFFVQKIPSWLSKHWHAECTDYLNQPIIYKNNSLFKRAIPAVLFVILSIAILLRFHYSFSLSIAALLFTWILLIASFIDGDYKILPDQLTLTLLWIGLLVNCFSLFTTLTSAIFGAVTGYLLLFITFHLYKLITKKEGLGYGDFKLLAAIGAWLGLVAIPITLLLASVLACIVIGGKMLLSKTSLQEQFPFGPFLAFAGWFVLVGKPFLLHFFPLLV